MRLSQSLVGAAIIAVASARACGKPHKPPHHGHSHSHGSHPGNKPHPTTAISSSYALPTAESSIIVFTSTASEEEPEPTASSTLETDEEQSTDIPDVSSTDVESSAAYTEAPTTEVTPTVTESESAIETASSSESSAETDVEESTTLAAPAPTYTRTFPADLLDQLQDASMPKLAEYNAHRAALSKRQSTKCTLENAMVRREWYVFTIKAIGC